MVVDQISIKKLNNTGDVSGAKTGTYQSNEDKQLAAGVSLWTVAAAQQHGKINNTEATDTPDGSSGGGSILSRAKSLISGITSGTAKAEAAGNKANADGKTSTSTAADAAMQVLKTDVTNKKTLAQVKEQEAKINTLDKQNQETNAKAENIQAEIEDLSGDAQAQKPAPAVAPAPTQTPAGNKDGKATQTSLLSPNTATNSASAEKTAQISGLENELSTLNATSTANNSTIKSSITGINTLKQNVLKLTATGIAKSKAAVANSTKAAETAKTAQTVGTVTTTTGGACTTTSGILMAMPDPTASTKAVAFGLGIGGGVLTAGGTATSAIASNNATGAEKANSIATASGNSATNIANSWNKYKAPTPTKSA